jgi:hypothetical protein
MLRAGSGRDVEQHERVRMGSDSLVDVVTDRRNTSGHSLRGGLTLNYDVSLTGSDQYLRWHGVVCHRDQK